MKKNDVILGGGILIAALLLFLVMHLTRGEDGKQIQITVDGTIYGNYSLAKDQVIEVKEKDFYNRIRIQDGKAYMEEANCPDGYCEEQGKINGRSQTIVCLPHKLVVEVLDAEGLEHDSATEELPDTISK